MAGSPKTSSSSLFQSSAVMSYSGVREALPASHEVLGAAGQLPDQPRVDGSDSYIPNGTIRQWSTAIASSVRRTSRRPAALFGRYQLPILLIEGLTAPVRRTAVLPSDHRAQWCAGAGLPANDRFPLRRQRDADDLGVRCLPGSRPRPRARSTRCGLGPAPPIQDAEKIPTDACHQTS